MPYLVILMYMPVRTDVLNSVPKCEVETGRPIKMGLSECYGEMIRCGNPIYADITKKELEDIPFQVLADAFGSGQLVLKINIMSAWNGGKAP